MAGSTNGFDAATSFEEIMKENTKRATKETLVLKTRIDAVVLLMNDVSLLLLLDLKHVHYNTNAVACEGRAAQSQRVCCCL